MPGSRRIWSFACAKAQLSEVIERALAEGPKMIVGRGRRVFVVGAEEFESKTKQEGTLSEFLAASPLRGLRLPRLKKARDKPRNIEL